MLSAKTAPTGKFRVLICVDKSRLAINIKTCEIKVDSGVHGVEKGEEGNLRFFLK
jgi:hypothetical protein